MTKPSHSLSTRTPNDTNQLKRLTFRKAEALAQDHGLFLSLNGLTTLMPEVAETLSKHIGFLSLNGLGTLSDGVTAALCARA
jgi:hypothetical protein